MKSLKRTLFIAWGWLALPWLIAAQVVAFFVCTYFGVCFGLLILLWFLDMGETTCSRCSAYGTGRCGVQSWLVPLFWAKRAIRGVSPIRVRLHFYFDVLMMAIGLAVFAFVPVVMPFFLAWIAIGWYVVYGPKEHHGLLDLVRPKAELESKGRFSLPLLPKESCEKRE